MQKMTQNKQYDHEYKVQAIKLAREIGSAKAASRIGCSQEYYVRLDESCS